MSKTAVIDAIKAKIDRLVADNRKLRGEYAELSQQRDRLAADNRELTAKAAELEKRIQILELREGMAGGNGDTKAAKARVNRLMREVDRCIALLNK